MGERIVFALLKSNARHQLKRQQQTKGFNGEGFIFAFLITMAGAIFGYFGFLAFGLLGLLFVICTLIFSKDKNFQKWALFGWLAAIVLSFIILFIELRNYG